MRREKPVTSVLSITLRGIVISHIHIVLGQTAHTNDPFIEKVPFTDRKITKMTTRSDLHRSEF